MQIRYAFVAVCLAAAFSGCNNYDGPREVVASSYQDLIKNDFGGFKDTLADDALEQFGTIEGAAKLKAQLGSTQFDIGPAQQVCENEDYDHNLVTTYTVAISAKDTGKAVFNLQVACTYRIYRNCQSWTGAGVPYDCTYTDNTECKITQLQQAAE